jgi:hypothetical protein
MACLTASMSRVSVLANCCIERSPDHPASYRKRSSLLGSAPRRRSRNRIVYRVLNDTVEILHVLHGARDYEPILFPNLAANAVEDRIGAAPHIDSRDRHVVHEIRSVAARDARSIS